MIVCVCVDAFFFTVSACTCVCLICFVVSLLRKILFVTERESMRHNYNILIKFLKWKRMRKKRKERKKKDYIKCHC